MAQYTPKEIADILFQREDRITANLNRASNGEAEKPKLGFKKLLGSWFDRARGTGREERSLGNAMDELCALGMPEKTVNMHVNALMYVVAEEFQVSGSLIACGPGGPGFFITNNVDWGPQYHLGVKNKDVTDINFDKRHRELLEVRSYRRIFEALESIITEKPELFTTAKDRPPGPEPFAGL